MAEEEEEEKKARVLETRARARDLQRWSVEEREKLGRRFRERKRVGLYRKRERRSFSESRVIIERVARLYLFTHRHTINQTPAFSN